MSRRMVGLATVVGVLILAASVMPALAGEWSVEQQGVWKDVQAYWEAWTKGDVDGFMTYVQPEYMGWSLDEPLPSGMDIGSKWMKFWSARNTIEIYDIRPAAIVVKGNVAVAYYYYSYVSKDTEGKMTEHHGRWADFLVKDGERWKLLGDHGGAAGGGESD